MHPLRSPLFAALLLCGAALSTLAPLGAARAAAGASSPEGFSVGIGLGWGRFDRDSCPGCRGQGGLSGYLDLAQPVSRALRVGLLATAWTHRVDESTRVACGNATLTLAGFVRPPGGLYFRGGAGLAGYSIDGGFDAGFGLTLGAGFEARPTARLGVGPYLNWYSGDFDRFNGHVLQLGVAVSLR